MEKILVCLSTWRSHFKKTVWMLSENIKKYGSNKDIFIWLLINYDLKFNWLKREDFNLNIKSYEFSKIEYFWEDEIKEYIDNLRWIWLNEQEIRPLVQTHWYGNRKNLLFLYALKNKYDYILFCDDDEYPITCINTRDGIDWINTDYIWWHIAGMRMWADITFWFWSWYISPIPTNIINTIPHSISHQIWEVLKIGTDVIDEFKFTNLENIFHIAKTVPWINETQEINWSKLISWWNSCFRLNGLLSWKIPPFYFPENTRGDDSIMSMRLTNAKVYSVPAWIFHDCFQDYIEITEWLYPTSFDFFSRKNDIAHYERFYKAFVWWLSYTPFLMKLRYKWEFEKNYSQMINLLRPLEIKFISYLPNLQSRLLNGKISDELDKYKLNVERNYEEMLQSDKKWKAILQNFFN